jgi:hypothetical protein
MRGGPRNRLQEKPPNHLPLLQTTFTPKIAKAQGDPDKSTASKLKPQRVLNPADKSPAQDTDGMHKQAATTPALSWDLATSQYFLRASPSTAPPAR